LVVGRGPAGPRPGSPLAWRGALRGPYLWLALAYVLQMAGVAVVSAVMPYLVTRVLGRETGDVGIAMAVILVTTMLAVPAWARLGARRGEARALRLAALLYGAAALLPTAVLLLAPGWPPFLASLVLLGAGFAGLQVLPFVLCARVIGQAGRSAEGALTGVWTAAEKVGLALGPSLTALALAVLRPSDHGALIVFAGLAPALLALVSLAPLRASRVAP
jgi:GPH family glycoside/pentoside/hexuronide:cation symporter